VRLAPSSVSKEDKKKEKMGHWMFRVLSLFSLCNNLSDSLSYSLSLSFSLFVSPACVYMYVYVCARKPANAQTLIWLNFQIFHRGRKSAFYARAKRRRRTTSRSVDLLEEKEKKKEKG